MGGTFTNLHSPVPTLKRKHTGGAITSYAYHTTSYACQCLGTRRTTELKHVAAVPEVLSLMFRHSQDDNLVMELTEAQAIRVDKPLAKLGSRPTRSIKAYCHIPHKHTAYLMHST